MSRRRFLKLGAGAAAAILVTGAGGSYAAGRLNHVERFDRDRLAELRAGGSSELLDRYPGLGDVVPWRPIGQFPSPVERLPSPAGASDVALFVKRDDACSGVYGGNNLRKLEHFLAEASLRGARRIVTVGGIGTHTGLATALHARNFGMETHIAVFDQPVTSDVRRNLRALAASGAHVRYGGGEVRALLGGRSLYTEAEADGVMPYFIMIGGATRLGTTGFINAALELAEQVRTGAMPEPSRIFVALGSGGTAAGLAAGCRLAGLRTRVTAVRVAPVVMANGVTVRYLANDALRWLRTADPRVPRVRVRFRDFDVIGDQLGDGYGHPTPAAEQAVAWAAGRLDLEMAHTGKAMAGCLHYCRTGARPGETVLFWNTFSSAPLPVAGSLRSLPPELRSAAAEPA